MKANELIESLNRIAPGIALETIWEHDQDALWDIDADPALDQDDFQCWQSEVTATAIFGGKRICGSDFLSGTWEKFGDHPDQSNPDISGYLPQMLEEAIRNLKKLLPVSAHALHVDCEVALIHLKKEMQKRYDEQRRDIATA